MFTNVVPVAAVTLSYGAQVHDSRDAKYRHCLRPSQPAGHGTEARAPGMTVVLPISQRSTASAIRATSTWVVAVASTTLQPPARASSR